MHRHAEPKLTGKKPCIAKRIYKNNKNNTDTTEIAVHCASTTLIAPAIYAHGGYAKLTAVFPCINGGLSETGQNALPNKILHFCKERKNANVKSIPTLGYENLRAKTPALCRFRPKRRRSSEFAAIRMIYAAFSAQGNGKCLACFNKYLLLFKTRKKCKKLF